MSVRPREVGEAASRFSLRSALAPAAAPLRPPPTAQQSAQLKFTLNVPKAPVSAASPAPALKLNFAQQLSKPTERPAANGHSQADVMRLTAVVDDLTKRLKGAQGKLEATECQLNRTQQALNAERQNAVQKVAGLKADLVSAHANEQKLRAELAARPAKAVLNTDKFMASVGSVLEQEQRAATAERESASLGASIEGLKAQKTALEAEIAQVKELREAALAERLKVEETLKNTRLEAEEVRAELKGLAAQVAEMQPAEALPQEPQEPQELLIDSLVDLPMEPAELSDTGCCRAPEPQEEVAPRKCEISGVAAPDSDLACSVGKTARLARRRLPAALPMSVAFDCPLELGQCCVDSFLDNDATGATPTDEMAAAVIVDLQSFLTRHVETSVPCPTPLVAPLAA